MKVRDVMTNPPKVLIYSGPGTGKTALALTLGERAQVIDLDDGLRTARSLNDKWKEDRLSVDVLQYLEEKPLEEALVFPKVKATVVSILNQCTSGTYPHKALIIDSVTSMADAALRYVLKATGRLNTNTPQIQEWGAAIAEVKKVMLLIRGMNIPVIVIGHEQIRDNDKIFLGLYGKNLPTQVPCFFDEFWRMRCKPAAGGKFKYVVETRSDAYAEAKTRGGLPHETDAGLGMWEILKLIGYEPKEK